MQSTEKLAESKRISMAEALRDVFNSIESAHYGYFEGYVRSGFGSAGKTNLDGLLGGGFKQGCISLVHGVKWKTEFLVNVLWHAQLRKENPAYFSNIKSPEAVTAMLLAFESHISAFDLANGKIKEGERFKDLIDGIERCGAEDAEVNFFQCDEIFNPEFIDQSLAELQDDAVKPSLVIVDSLNSLSPNGEAETVRLES